ncbi:MAG: VOC family protein [Clostridia bacterium]|nr:VOC family protein [Clostridia bacterium]
MQIHHVGYLVKKLDKAAASMEALGFLPVGEKCHDAGRQADFLFLANGGYTVELVAPEKESPLYPLLKQYTNSPYHLCYECEHLEETIAALAEKKYMLFKAPEAAPAISPTARVAFLMSASAGMIELVEGA